MVNRERLLMRLILASYLVMLCVLSANAAPATIIPNAAPISLNIRTAGDLANACTIKPTNKVDFARLNFCNGFAQGVLQTNQQNQNGTRICVPNPSPKRSETMVEFARWVRADASRKDDMASTAFLLHVGAVSLHGLAVDLVNNGGLKQALSHTRKGSFRTCHMPIMMASASTTNSRARDHRLYCITGHSAAERIGKISDMSML